MRFVKNLFRDCFADGNLISEDMSRLNAQSEHLGCPSICQMVFENLKFDDWLISEECFQIVALSIERASFKRLNSPTKLFELLKNFHKSL